MLKLIGSPAEIEDVKRAIEADEIELKVTDQGDVRDKVNFGMEPLSYLVVVFGGHLAAALVHDQIESIISKYLKGKKSIRVEEMDEDDEL